MRGTLDSLNLLGHLPATIMATMQLLQAPFSRALFCSEAKDQQRKRRASWLAWIAVDLSLGVRLETPLCSFLHEPKELLEVHRSKDSV